MGRYASHKGHVILPLGDGWTVPDYMSPDEDPVTVQKAKQIIDQRESEGAAPRETTSVTFDALIVGTGGAGIGINLGQAASAIKAGRGDRVRITMEKVEKMTHNRKNAAKQRAMARKNIDPEKEWTKIIERIESPDAMEFYAEDPASVLILDTETTGLSPVEDDVLELAIISGAGVTLHNARYASWWPDWSEEAQRVNHITPEMVRGLPTLESDAARISTMLRRASVIVGYNIGFDLDFLANAGVTFPHVPICDVMKDFASVYGEWADWIDGYGDWKWQKLTTAGRHYRLDISGAHGALADCKLTLEVLKRVAAEPESKRHRARPVSD